MLLGAAGGRSAIPKQAPVPFIAECAILCRTRTAELASRTAALKSFARGSQFVYLGHARSTQRSSAEGDFWWMPMNSSSGSTVN